MNKFQIKSTCFRLFSGALAVIFFLTGSALAHVPQTQIWNERRRALQQQTSHPKPITLASLPLKTPSLATSLRSFSGDSTGLIDSHNIPAALKPQILSVLKSIPPATGSVRKIVPSEKPRAKIVIHIQDIHGNAEAQENIRQLTERLTQQQKINLVALEGAFGTLDFSKERRFPYPDLMKVAADYLLNKNKISGAVHASLLAGAAPIEIVGIDDKTEYDANVEAYRSASKEIETQKDRLAEQQKKLDQKVKYLNPALLSFRQQMQAYRRGTLSLSTYVSQLAGQTQNIPASVQKYLEAAKLEKTLPMAKIDLEKVHLLNALTQKLSPTENQTLLEHSMALRSGQINPASFFDQLRILCERKNIALSRYPNVDHYIRYVALSYAVAPEALGEDVEKMEEALLSRLATTEAERKLFQQLSHLDLTQKLLDFSLSKKEWLAYKKGRTEKSSSLRDFEAFYEQAEKRDQRMAQNLLYEIEASQSPVSLVVTGGFHSDGMLKPLTQAGLTVINFVPRITKVETLSGSQYLSVFTQEKTPLDQFLEGNKLFLAANPAAGQPGLPDLTQAVVEAVSPAGPIPAPQQEALTTLGANAPSNDGPGPQQVTVGGSVITFERAEGGALSITSVEVPRSQPAQPKRPWYRGSKVRLPVLIATFLVLFLLKNYLGLQSSSENFSTQRDSYSVPQIPSPLSEESTTPFVRRSSSFSPFDWQISANPKTMTWEDGSRVAKSFNFIALFLDEPEFKVFEQMGEKKIPLTVSKGKPLVRSKFKEYELPSGWDRSVLVEIMRSKNPEYFLSIHPDNFSDEAQLISTLSVEIQMLMEMRIPERREIMLTYRYQNQRQILAIQNGLRVLKRIINDPELNRVSPYLVDQLKTVEIPRLESQVTALSNSPAVPAVNIATSPWSWSMIVNVLGILGLGVGLLYRFWPGREKKISEAPADLVAPVKDHSESFFSKKVTGWFLVEAFGVFILLVAALRFLGFLVGPLFFFIPFESQGYPALRATSLNQAGFSLPVIIGVGALIVTFAGITAFWFKWFKLRKSFKSIAMFVENHSAYKRLFRAAGFLPALNSKTEIFSVARHEQRQRKVVEKLARHRKMDASLATFLNTASELGALPFGEFAYKYIQSFFGDARPPRPEMTKKILGGIITLFRARLPVPAEQMQEQVQRIVNGSIPLSEKKTDSAKETDSAIWPETRLVSTIRKTIKNIEEVLLAARLGWLDNETALEKLFSELFKPVTFADVKNWSDEQLEGQIVELAIDFYSRRHGGLKRGEEVGFHLLPQAIDDLRGFWSEADRIIASKKKVIFNSSRFGEVIQAAIGPIAADYKAIAFLGIQNKSDAEILSMTNSHPQHEKYKHGFGSFVTSSNETTQEPADVIALKKGIADLYDQPSAYVLTPRPPPGQRGFVFNPFAILVRNIPTVSLGVEQPSKPSLPTLSASTLSLLSNLFNSPNILGGRLYLLNNLLRVLFAPAIIVHELGHLIEGKISGRNAFEPITLRHFVSGMPWQTPGVRALAGFVGNIIFIPIVIMLQTPQLPLWNQWALSYLLINNLVFVVLEVGLTPLAGVLRITENPDLAFLFTQKSSSISQPTSTLDPRAALALYLETRNNARGVTVSIQNDIAGASETMAAEIVKAWQHFMFDAYGNPTKEPILMHFCTGDTPWGAYSIIVDWMNNWVESTTQDALRRHGIKTDLKPDMSRVLARPLDAIFPQKRTEYYSFAFQLQTLFDKLGIPLDNRQFFYGDLIDDNGTNRVMTEAEYEELLADVSENGLRTSAFLSGRLTVESNAIQYRHLTAMQRQADAMSKEIEEKGGAAITLIGVGPSYDGWGHVGFIERGKPADQKAFIDKAVHYVTAGHAKEVGGYSNFYTRDGRVKIGVITYGYHELFYRARQGKDQRLIAIATNNNKARSVQRAIETETQPSEVPLSVVQELGQGQNRGSGVLIVDDGAASQLRLLTHPWEFQEILNWTPDLVKRFFIELSREVGVSIPLLTSNNAFSPKTQIHEKNREIRTKNLRHLLKTKSWESLRSAVVQDITKRFTLSKGFIQKVNEPNSDKQLKAGDTVLIINPHLDDDFLAMQAAIRSMVNDGLRVVSAYLAKGFTAVTDDYAFHILEEINSMVDRQIDEAFDLKDTTQQLSRLNKRALRGSNVTWSEDMYPWEQMNATEKTLRAQALLAQMKTWLREKDVSPSPKNVRALIRFVIETTKSKPKGGSTDLKIMQEIKTWIRITSNASAMMSLGLKYEDILPPMDVSWYTGQGRTTTVAQSDVVLVEDLIKKYKPRMLVTNGERFRDWNAHANTEASTYHALLSMMDRHNEDPAKHPIDPQGMIYLQYAGVWENLRAEVAGISIVLSEEETKLASMNFPQEYPDQAFAAVPDSGLRIETGIERLSHRFFSDQVHQNETGERKEMIRLLGEAIPFSSVLTLPNSGVHHYRFVDVTRPDTIAFMKRTEEELGRVRVVKEMSSNEKMQGPLPRPALFEQNLAALQSQNASMAQVLADLEKGVKAPESSPRNPVNPTSVRSAFYGVPFNWQKTATQFLKSGVSGVTQSLMFKLFLEIFTVAKESAEEDFPYFPSASTNRHKTLPGDLIRFLSQRFNLSSQESGMLIHLVPSNAMAEMPFIELAIRLSALLAKEKPRAMQRVFQDTLHVVPGPSDLRMMIWKELKDLQTEFGVEDKRISLKVVKGHHLDRLAEIRRVITHSDVYQHEHYELLLSEEFIQTKILSNESVQQLMISGAFVDESHAKRWLVRRFLTHELLESIFRKHSDDRKEDVQLQKKAHTYLVKRHWLGLPLPYSKDLSSMTVLDFYTRSFKDWAKAVIKDSPDVFSRRMLARLDFDREAAAMALNNIPSGWYVPNPLSPLIYEMAFVMQNLETVVERLEIGYPNGVPESRETTDDQHILNFLDFARNLLKKSGNIKTPPSPELMSAIVREPGGVKSSRRFVDFILEHAGFVPDPQTQAELDSKLRDIHDAFGPFKKPLKVRAVKSLDPKDPHHQIAFVVPGLDEIFISRELLDKVRQNHGAELMKSAQTLAGGPVALTLSDSKYTQEYFEELAVYKLLINGILQLQGISRNILLDHYLAEVVPSKMSEGDFREPAFFGLSGLARKAEEMLKIQSGSKGILEPKLLDLPPASSPIDLPKVLALVEPKLRATIPDGVASLFVQPQTQWSAEGVQKLNQLAGKMIQPIDGAYKGGLMINLNGSEMVIFKPHELGPFSVSPFSGMAVDPNENYVVGISKNRENVALVWNIKAGPKAAPKELIGHSEPIRSFAISHEGTQVSTAGEGKKIIVWNSNTGKPTREFRGHSHPITAQVFSPDGRLLLSGDEGGWIFLWDVGEGRLLFREKAHEGAVTSVAFGPQGRIHFSLGKDKNLRIGRTASGAQLAFVDGARKDISQTPPPPTVLNVDFLLNVPLMMGKAPEVHLMKVGWPRAIFIFLVFWGGLYLGYDFQVFPHAWQYAMAALLPILLIAIEETIHLGFARRDYRLRIEQNPLRKFDQFVPFFSWKKLAIETWAEPNWKSLAFGQLSFWAAGLVGVVILLHNHTFPSITFGILVTLSAFANKEFFLWWAREGVVEPNSYNQEVEGADFLEWSAPPPNETAKPYAPSPIRREFEGHSGLDTKHSHGDNLSVDYAFLSVEEMKRNVVFAALENRYQPGHISIGNVGLFRQVIDQVEVALGVKGLVEINQKKKKWAEEISSKLKVQASLTEADILEQAVSGFDLDRKSSDFIFQQLRELKSGTDNPKTSAFKRQITNIVGDVFRHMLKINATSIDVVLFEAPEALQDEHILFTQKFEADDLQNPPSYRINIALHSLNRLLQEHSARLKEDALPWGIQFTDEETEALVLYRIVIGELAMVVFGVDASELEAVNLYGPIKKEQHPIFSVQSLMAAAGQLMPLIWQESLTEKLKGISLDHIRAREIWAASIFKDARSALKEIFGKRLGLKSFKFSVRTPILESTLPNEFLSGQGFKGLVRSSLGQSRLRFITRLIRQGWIFEPLKGSVTSNLNPASMMVVDQAHDFKILADEFALFLRSNGNSSQKFVVGILSTEEEFKDRFGKFYEAVKERYPHEQAQYRQTVETLWKNINSNVSPNSRNKEKIKLIFIDRAQASNLKFNNNNEVNVAPVVEYFKMEAKKISGDEPNEIVFVSDWRFLVLDETPSSIVVKIIYNLNLFGKVEDKINFTMLVAKHA